MLSESAHLAARLQKDLLTRSSTGGETLSSGASSGTPSTVNLDRSVSSSLLHLSKHELSLDALGLLASHHQDNVEGHIRPGFFDSNSRNSLSFALTEMTKVLERAAPEVKKVRSASSVPQTVHATCELMKSLAGVAHALNDQLLHLHFPESNSVSSTGIEVRHQRPEITTRSGSGSSKSTNHQNDAKRSTTTVSEKSRTTLTGTTDRPHSCQPVSHNEGRLQDDNKISEVHVLQSEIRRMKAREEILLKRVRDLEIDCRVKAHTVASTTASAQAVFDENTILRQIAEHNQSLLREVDALHRCVAENETLNMELASRQKTIDSLTNKVEQMKMELRRRPQENS